MMTLSNFNIYCILSCNIKAILFFSTNKSMFLIVRNIHILNEKKKME